MKLTQEELKSLLKYSKKSGLFTWKLNRGGRIKAGNIAGSINGEGYISITLKGKQYLAHRLAWLYVKGYWPESDIDHRDRVKSNNVFNNIREVSDSCNMKNRKVQINNKTGITGVIIARGKFKVSISKKGKIAHVGYFKTLFEAAFARYFAELENKYLNCKKDSTAGKYIDQYFLEKITLEFKR